MGGTADTHRGEQAWGSHDGADAGGDTLCLILDRRAAEDAIAAAASVSRGGKITVLSAHSIMFAWANPLAGLMGMPAIGDHGILARDEITDLAAGLDREVEPVWIEDAERLREVAEARLGEGNFGVVVIGCRSRSRRLHRIVRGLRDSATRTCTVVEID